MTDTHTFYLKVTAKTVHEPDPDEPDFSPELDPGDFAAFLNSRFTVSPDAKYGLDAYNKDAPNQLILDVEVADAEESAASACPSDIIFHTENIGTDGDPVLRASVSCDLDMLGCGFSVQFTDDEGTNHHPHDFWVTSDDFRRYEALHQAHAREASHE